MKTGIVLLVALGAGFGAGFGVARWLPRDISQVLPDAHTSSTTASLGRAQPTPDGETLSAEHIIERLRDETRRGLWRRNKSWQVILNATSPEDLSRIVVATRDLILAPRQQPLRDALLARWGECDPAAALHFAEGIRSPQLRPRAIEAVLRGWIFTHPTEAAAWVLKMPKGTERNDALARVITEIAPGDADAALALLSELPPHQSSHAYYTTFRAIAAADPAQAAAKLEKMTVTMMHRSSIVNAIAQQWAEQNPAEAIAWAQSLPASGERLNTMRQVVSEWVRSDAAAAFRFVETQPAGQQRDNLLRDAVTNLALVSPQVAAAQLRSLPAGSLRTSLYSDAAILMAEHNLAEALKLTEEIPAGFARDNANRQLIGRLAQQDPEAALARIQNTARPHEREQLLLSATFFLAQTEPELAAAFAKALPAGNAQRNAFTAVVSALTQISPQKALQWIDALPDSVAKRRSYEQMAYTYAQADPGQAAQWALGLSKDLRANTLPNVMGQWVQQDPDAALRWLDTVSDPTLKRNSIKVAVNTLAYSNPRAAYDLIARRMHDVDFDDGTLTTIATVWASQDVSAAVAKAEEIPAGRQRDTFISGLISSLAENAPATATTYLAQLPPGLMQTNATIDLATRWSSQDPVAAANWLGGLKDEALREAALPRLVDNWGVVDPEGVTSWLSSLPKDRARDQGFATFTQSIAHESPATAARWVASIADPALREAAVENVARQWLARDRASATSWLATQSLSEELRLDLLAEFGP